MARQTSTITVTGKLGNMVGAKGYDGKYNAFHYVPGDERSNPKTTEQVYQRSKLALAAKVAGMLGILGNQVLVANGMRPNRRGALVRNIMQYIDDAVGGPALGTRLPLVRSPRAKVEITDRAFAVLPAAPDRSGNISYNFTGNALRGTAVRYLVSFMIYDPTLDQWIYTCEVQTTPAKVYNYVDESMNGHEVFCYAYVLAVTTDPTTLGSEGIMGPLTGTEEGFNIAVDSQGVLYGKNIAFSQIDTCVQRVSILAS